MAALAKMVVILAFIAASVYSINTEHYTAAGWFGFLAFISLGANFSFIIE